MNHFFQLTIVAILVTIVLSSPITGDYSKKEYEDECKQAENFLSNALKKYVDEEFVQAYGKILMDGLHRLNKKTEDAIKNETDGTKKQEAINFAYDSCERLLLFMKDLEDKMKQ
ncbi:uncharacterized protein LOC124500081 isoform X2 [Dermatophagoides farinae]|uniref:Uncharacterized protein n=1 Tax=Dermatophagoides farinae TaxID=6954 RepID=A0A922KY06_DERFA|nr:uncharacterized protein LOC124500081 [Dermatophagoides farinae]KAH7645630.1 hypothetical protein HUG17_1168 [Dermatophagoides farinae]KAH9490488.1 hypothetical protein DERF_016688 [Dermatophagoides farinae]